MIKPDAESLVDTIKEIIDDPDMNRHLKNLAIMTSTIQSFAKTYSHPDAQFSMEKANEYATALFSFAKFELGQSVMLGNKWDVSIAEQSSGWSHSAHFLHTGARCKIHSVDYDKDRGGFIYDVIFDVETWIPKHGEDEGIPQPVSRKHTFCMAERYLVEDEGPYIIRQKDAIGDWIFIAEEDDFNTHLEKFKNALELSTYDEAKKELSRQMKIHKRDDLEIVTKAQAAQDYFGDCDS